MPFKATGSSYSPDYKYRKMGAAKEVIKSYLEDHGVPTNLFFPTVKWGRTLSSFWTFDDPAISLAKPAILRGITHEADHCLSDLEISNALHGFTKQEIAELLIKVFERRTRLGFEGPNILSPSKIREPWLCMPKFNTKKIRTDVAILLGKVLREEPCAKVLHNEIDKVIESNPEFSDAYTNKREAYYALNIYLLSRKELYHEVKNSIETIQKKLPGNILNLTQEEKERIISRVLVHIPEIEEAHLLENTQSLRIINKAYNVLSAVESLDKKLASEEIDPEKYLHSIKHLIKRQSMLDYRATINDEAPSEYLGGHLERKATAKGLLVAWSEGERVTPSDFIIQRDALLLYRRAQKLVKLDGIKLHTALEEVNNLREKTYPKLSFSKALEKIRVSKKLSPETLEQFENIKQYLEFTKIKRRIKRLRPHDSWSRENLQQDLTVLLSLKCIGNIEPVADANKRKALRTSAEEAILEEWDLVKARLRIQEALRYSPKDKAVISLAKLIDDNCEPIVCEVGSSVTIKYSTAIFLNKRFAICKFDDLPKDLQDTLDSRVGYFIVDTTTGKNIELKNGTCLELPIIKDEEKVAVTRSQDRFFISKG